MQGSWDYRFWGVLGLQVFWGSWDYRFLGVLGLQDLGGPGTTGFGGSWGTKAVFCVQAFGVFGLCQIHAFIDYLRSKLSQTQFDTLFWSLVVMVSSAVIVLGGALTFMGSTCVISKGVKLLILFCVV